MQQKHRGSAKVTLRDHLSGVLAATNVIRVLVFLVFALWLAQLVLEYDIPEFSMVEVIATGVLNFSIVGIMFFLMLVFLCAQFLRLSDAQRDMTWEIDEFGVNLWDGAGTQVRIPWTQTKSFREKKAGFVIRFIPFGWRWIPKHAFADEDIEGVRQLLQSNAGKQ